MAEKRTTFSVAFCIRRTRLNKHGESPISLRITVNCLRAETTVKKTISPNLWDSLRGRASAKNILGKEINLYLDAVRAKVTRIHRDMEMDGERITAQKVLDRYLGRDEEERHTILQVFREHNEKCRKLTGIDMSPATVERYETCFNHTQEFIRFTYHKDDFYLDEMNRQFVEDYEFYLKTERACNHNTTTKYLKNFKKITRIAINKEWLKKDPFADIRFSLNPVERDFLEKHEIDKMMKKEIDIERLAQVRDIFIFCSLTGLAFSDVKQLTADHIAIDVQGNKWIRKPRQKTKNMCNIPLLEIPLKILEKYKDNSVCQMKGVLLPVLCNQKMNAYLKELGDICGIKKQLSTHVARHTFATYTLANGVSIESVSKMLGHSDTKMTRHYAKVLDQTILREMNAIPSDF